jgi:hypothetical protein
MVESTFRKDISADKMSTKALQREVRMLNRKIVRIIYHENPEILLDVAVYDAESTSYEIRYIHPSHHAEVDNIEELRQGVTFEVPAFLRDWIGFLNALQMLPDQYIRDLDVIVLTRAGEVIEE